MVFLIKMSDDFNCIVEGFMGGDDVLLDGWMFCCGHSTEHCHFCCRDHRMANNEQFQDELTEAQYEALTDYGTEDLADREPLSVLGLWKKLSNGRPACTRHSKVGCQACFNFKSMVLERAGLLQPTDLDEAAAAVPAPATTSAAAAPPADGDAQGTQKVCHNCGVSSNTLAPGEKLRKCARCKRVRYCSKECQEADHSQHKEQCRQWAAELTA